MATTSRVYYTHDTAPPYSPLELKLTYKGLPIERSKEYSLYSIVPPDGYDIVAQLAGSYTKLDTLKEAIDRFILSSHLATDAFIKQNAPAKRGRPVLAKNKPTLADLLQEKEIQETETGE
jgi:hypothetical protein